MVSHYPDESLRDFHIKSTFGRFVAGKDIQLIDSDSVNLKLIFRITANDSIATDADYPLN